MYDFFDYIPSRSKHTWYMFFNRILKLETILWSTWLEYMCSTIKLVFIWNHNNVSNILHNSPNILHIVIHKKWQTHIYTHTQTHRPAKSPLILILWYYYRLYMFRYLPNIVFNISGQAAAVYMCNVYQYGLRKGWVVVVRLLIKFISFTHRWNYHLYLNFSWAFS